MLMTKPLIVVINLYFFIMTSSAFNRRGVIHLFAVTIVYASYRQCLLRIWICRLPGSAETPGWSIADRGEGVEVPHF